MTLPLTPAQRFARDRDALIRHLGLGRGLLDLARADPTYHLNPTLAAHASACITTALEALRGLQPGPPRDISPQRVADIAASGDRLAKRENRYHALLDSGMSPADAFARLTAEEDPGIKVE